MVTKCHVALLPWPVFKLDTCVRDGLVGPVSQYQEHFTEILLQYFKSTTSLVNTNNGRNG